jgi:CDP-diacylglycerol--serine O-phosphatidyltransferase
MRYFRQNYPLLKLFIVLGCDRMEQNQTPLPPKITSRGIYLLPNLFTTAALFAGFYAILASMQHHFAVAGVAVFIAMIADGLDGRVARMTNTQTAFGAEYDSLSDMVAFAVAPALIVYNWSLFSFGKIGWLIAFLYTAATALRLARFNTQVLDTGKSYFQGLPCPSAAAVVVGMVWLGNELQLVGTSWLVAGFAAIITIVSAALMVSNIRYYSFKEIDFTGKVTFFAVIGGVLVITAVALAPPQVLFLGFLSYACSGPIITLWQLRKLRGIK